MNFREQIKALMAQQSLSAYRVAKGAGLKTRATLYNYLNKDSSITADNLEKILTFLRGLPIKKRSHHKQATQERRGTPHEGTRRSLINLSPRHSKRCLRKCETPDL